MMNTIQQVVLTLGIALFVVACAFPPYQGKVTMVRCQAPSLEKEVRVGYHFILQPPCEDEVLSHGSEGEFPARFGSSQVILSEAILELLFIAAVTCWLLVLLRRCRKAGTPAVHSPETTIDEPGR
jgi:hypothetical protein